MASLSSLLRPRPWLWLCVLLSLLLLSPVAPERGGGKEIDWNFTSLKAGDVLNQFRLRQRIDVLGARLRPSISGPRGEQRQQQRQGSRPHAKWGEASAAEPAAAPDPGDESTAVEPSCIRINSYCLGKVIRM
jgi:hypothetical protein